MKPKSVVVVCCALVLALATVGAAPVKPPTTPFGYEVRAVSQEYSSTPKPLISPTALQAIQT